MDKHEPIYIKYASGIFLVFSVIFCAFGAVGSAYEIYNTEMNQRSFQYSPWFLFQWSLANLFWIFCNQAMRILPSWIVIAYAFALIILDGLTAIIISAEQAALSFLPITILSLMFFATGVYRLGKD